MTDKQISARFQQFIETMDQLLLGGSVEINHYIAAEDYIKRSFHRPWRQKVQPGQPHNFTDALDDTIAFRRLAVQSGEIFLELR